MEILINTSNTEEVLNNNNNNNTDDYKCDICNYKCKYKSQYIQHLKTNKHKNNGIITKNLPNKFDGKCKLCKYESTSSSNMKVHILANHTTNEEKKEKAKYYCDVCNYGTYIKVHYENHCNTLKHKNNVN